jgi:hypothetical protein
MTTFLAAALLFAAAAGAQQKSRHATQGTMDGCLDQEGSAYILREPTELNKIAELDAVSFKQDYFANFVGNKVTVYGKVTNNRTVPVIHVSRVEKHPGACEPRKSLE